MNTIEKRKLEGVLTSALSEAREAYKQKRERAHTQLVGKIEKTPPEKVRKLMKQLADTKDKYNAEIQALEKQVQAKKDGKREAIEVLETEAKGLGFAIGISYGDDKPYASLTYSTEYTGRYGNTRVRKYEEPTINKFEQDTIAGLQKFDALTTKYTLSLWAESGDMSKLLDQFNADVSKLVA